MVDGVPANPSWVSAGPVYKVLKEVMQVVARFTALRIRDWKTRTDRMPTNTDIIVAARFMGSGLAEPTYRPSRYSTDG